MFYIRLFNLYYFFIFWKRKCNLFMCPIILFIYFNLFYVAYRPSLYHFIFNMPYSWCLNRLIKRIIPKTLFEFGFKQILQSKLMSFNNLYIIDFVFAEDRTYIHHFKDKIKWGYKTNACNNDESIDEIWINVFIYCQSIALIKLVN